MIPVNDLEDISLMDCDYDIESNVPSRWQGRMDTFDGMEGGDKHLKEAQKAGSGENRSRSDDQQSNELVRDFIKELLVKVREYAEFAVAFAQRQREAFDAKSKSEKTVAILIGSGLLILFILLIALVA
ncbi:MAG: hypothetical protein SGILL_005019 [Bacillariaceae sp.]